MGHDSDSDDSGRRGRPKTSLTQLMNDVPARETILNSCSEDSDSDDDSMPQPLPITRPRAAGDLPSWMLGSSSGRNTPALATMTSARPKPALTPKNTNHIQKTEGYGGRLVYAVTSEEGPSNYYCVQW